MKKRNYLRRLLSVVLMVAMIVGMVNMPAKAAEVATKDVTIDSFKYSGSWFDPQFHGSSTNWRVYFNMSDSLVIPSDSAYNFNLKLSNGDEEREVGFTSTSAEPNVIYTSKLPSDFLDGCKAQTITIKSGTYKAINAEYALNLTADCVFYVNAYSWSMKESEVTPTVKQKATFSLDTSVHDGAGGTAAGFYLKPNFDDGSKSGADWKTDVTPMRVDYAAAVDTIHYGGVLVNGERQSKRVIKVAAQSYYVELLGAEQGKEYTVRGFFTDADGKSYAYLPITVTWDGTKWTEKDLGVLESYESTLEVSSNWRGSGLNAIVLEGTDGYMMDDKFLNVEPYFYLYPDQNSGIKLNGEKIETAQLEKTNAFSKLGVYYIGTLPKTITTGDVITIEGDFYSLDKKTKITYRKAQFIYDATNTRWDNYYESSLVMHDMGWFDTSGYNPINSVIYARGLDTYLDGVGEAYGTSDRKLVPDSNDSESGIYVNGTKTSLDFQKTHGGQGDTKHMYCIAGLQDIKTGDVVTVKGNFATQDNKTKIHFAESKLQWNGTAWIEYVPTDDNVASVTMAPHFNNGWFAPTYDESKGGWRVYFYTSDALKGNTDDKYTVTVSNGTTNQEVTFSQSSNTEKKELYAYLPTSIVDGTKTQTITIKAGEYKATDKDNIQQEYGMNLISDSKIYITEYGWSSDESMVTPTTAPVSFTLKGGSASGIDLTADVDDTVPFGSEWEEGKVLPTLISQETYGVQSGVAKNGTLTEVYMMKIAKQSYYVALSDKGQSANTGDVYTIKGMFRHADGQSIACTELKVKWNGESWEKVFDSFETNLSWKLGGDWFYPTYDANQDGWRIYLKADMNIPALQGEVYKLNVKIDGTTHVINFTKSDADSPNMHAYIPKSLVSGAKTQTIEFLSGTYHAFSGAVQKDYTMTVKNTLIMRVNEYGWTTEATHIAPSYSTKENIQLDTSVANGGANTGFYVTTDVNDGLEVNGWDTRIYIPAATDTTYYSGGVWKQAAGATKKTQSYQKSQLIKLKDNQYFVAIQDSFEPATAGDTYTVGGIFEDRNTNTTYGFSTITVTWDGEKWTQNYQPLDDTGVKYDVNADTVAPTAKDLIALLKYNADNSYRINTAQADINNDSKINKEDVVKLRKVMVGMYDSEGNYVGVPTYSANRTFEKMAYACPVVGEWNSDHTVFTPYGTWTSDGEFEPNESLATTMRQFKNAGLTLINSEDVGSYEEVAAFDSEANEPMRVYLKLAERYGLGVLVFDVDLYRRARDNDFTDTYETGKTWEANLEQRISALQAYSSAFRGFMIWDEIPEANYDAYKKIVDYLMETHPELMLRTSYRPLASTDFSNNAAYQAYVEKFAPLTNHFSYNYYPLEYKYKDGSESSTKEYFVLDKWFDNLQQVGTIAKNKNYSFDTGITIQAYSSNAYIFEKKTLAKNIMAKKYTPEESKDIGFQVYTAMAYGMKEINYFDYRKHPKDSNVLTGMVDDNGTPNAVYTAVQTINKQIDKFANVYQAFSWRDTIDIAAGSNGTFTTDNSRLKSASVTGARTLIGYMVDTDGFDGYMIANANGPRNTDGSVATATANVTLEFNNASKVLIYDFAKGTKEIKTVSGEFNISVPVGGGIMVIPVR